MADQYDIIVIGGGPGGYVAAIRAAQLGLKTAVVEREHLGGICLNWGCIPTKALLRSAEIYHYMNHAKDYGLVAEKIGFDAAAIVQRSRGVSGRLNGGVGMLLKKNKVDVIWGEATIPKPGEVVVTEPKSRDAAADAAAQGRTRAGDLSGQAHHHRDRRAPARPAGDRADGKLIWTYFEAMVPTEMPKSMLVMGSGAIGIEFASFYRTMGAEVTVVEVLPQILPVEDAEIAAHARKRFEKQGIKILTGAKVTKVEKGANSVTATIDDGKAHADHHGRALDLRGRRRRQHRESRARKARREARSRHDRHRWARPHQRAGHLCHRRRRRARRCWRTRRSTRASSASRPSRGLHTHPMDKLTIPGCTYCHPQIASVGLTEAKAKEQGIEVRVGRFPFVGNGKAIALGEPEGLVKTIFDKKTGQLLGAHLVGAEVTELIQGFVIAMNLETTEEELIHAVFPHPTLSETMHESVLDAYGRVIHI